MGRGCDVKPGDSSAHLSLYTLEIAGTQIGTVLIATIRLQTQRCCVVRRRRVLVSANFK